MRGLLTCCTRRATPQVTRTPDQLLRRAEKLFALAPLREVRLTFLAGLRTLPLDGYNNLSIPCAQGLSGSSACAQAIVAVAFGVRDLIRIGKRTEYGVRYIFVSTMTPPGPYLGIPPDRRIANDAIVRANTGIANMVRSEGATLVDTYPRFIGHESEYVDQDGLHLRPAGYQALADSFFTAIKNTVTSTPAFGARSN